MVKSARDRKAIKQLFLNYICPTHTDWLFFSYWLSSLILSSLLVMPVPLLRSHYTLPPSLSLDRSLIHPLPILSSAVAYLLLPALPMFQDDTRFREAPLLPDLWHCLLHQLPCPSLINFDVEPNEIRPSVEAVADSCLIYACVRQC